MLQQSASFHGRGREIALLMSHLEEIRATGRGRLLALRGRRRVGKSRLVEEFAHRAGVPYVFFAASRQAPERQLELFIEAALSSNLPDETKSLLAQVAPRNWEAALTLVASHAQAGAPTVIVLDEFPYLLESERTLDATLQKAWDRALERAPALLLLIGSDLSMMESLTAYGSALHGRPREMVLAPLSPAEIASFLQVGASEALDAYLVIGGFPLLALSWAPGKSQSEFLQESLEDSTSPLIVNAERAIAGEFPVEAHARSVLSVIGTGERAFTPIQARSGLNQTSLSAALKLLVTKRVAAKETPFAAGGRGKSPRYRVADPYLRFWLRFIAPNLELVERGRGRLVLERIESGWEQYRGTAIEPIVREAIERMLPDARFGEARHVGGYWTRDGSVEVDLVGVASVPAPQRVAFVGSVKWREAEPFDRNDLARLIQQRGLVPGADEGTRLVGVSRSGFATEGLDAVLQPEELLAVWAAGGSATGPAG